MEGDKFKCSLCCFVTNHYLGFQQHFVRKHQHDANFSVTCCINSCGFQTRNWGTFRSHVSRMHRHQKDLDLGTEAVNVEVPESEGNPEQGYRHVDLQYQNAVYTLALEAEYNITQKGINGIVDSTATLVKQHVQVYADKAKRALQDHGIDPSLLDNITTDTLLENFESAPKRQKYYEKNLPYVSPVEVQLGIQKKLMKGVLTDVPIRGYMVPFLDSIKVMLEMPEVWHSVCTGHTSQDEFLHDICDGMYVRSNSLFANNSRALQILLYTDDVELVNPLGSHVKKYKVTMFYYALANIEPARRSSLHSIQLLAIAKTVDVRKPLYIDKLLADFISGVQLLSSTGVRLLLHGEYHNIQGALVSVFGDTLAAHWLGGFKEGVAFAQKMCRNCECRGREMRTVFLSSSCILRNDDVHKDRCMMLEGDLSAKAKQYWSKVWGINGASSLQSLNFPLTTGFVQDPMHVLLEGVVPHELSLLLYKMIYVQKLCTDAFLNSSLTGFDYSYLHVNSKPERIDKSSIADCMGIKQTASAMLTLCYVLPLILGPRVPENNVYWLNWLRLLRIVLLCTSPYCSCETASLLRILVAEYLQEFQNLYPRASFIPKMHYLLHLPDQMLQYGPLRHHWCMRFEAKNGFFKGKKWRQFVNIPLSLAKYHQVYMVHRQIGSSGELSENYLYSGDIVQEGELTCMEGRFSPVLISQISDAVGHAVSTLYLTNFVSIHGLQYKPDCAIVTDYAFDDVPSFGIVRHIFVDQKVKYFIVEETNSELDSHILYYTLEPMGTFQVVPFHHLKFNWPYSVYTYKGKCVVLNSCSHTCPLV
jgi:hypothetical protein